MKADAYLPPRRDVATSLPRDARTSTSLFPGKGRGRFFSPPSPVDGRRKDVFRQHGARCCDCFPAPCNSANGMQAIEALALHRLGPARFGTRGTIHLWESRRRTLCLPAPSVLRTQCRGQYELPEWLARRQCLIDHSNSKRRQWPRHGPTRIPNPESRVQNSTRDFDILLRLA